MVNLDESAARAGSAEVFGASEREFVSFARGAPASRSAALAQLIEADVIPRLMLARDATVRRPPGHARSLEVDPDDIDDFADMMVRLELRKAELVVSAALASGVPIESVLLDLLTPTARRLGQMWVDDERSFTDVTVGLCALQNLLRSVTSGDAVEPRQVVDARVLIAAAPGEQHTFGVLMIETLFRKAGWDTVGLPITDADEVRAAVARQDFAVVGFSLSRESGLDDLATLIRDVRKVSRNRRTTIMVGGRVFNDDPALIRQVGADMTARDGRGAVVASQNVVCSRVRTH